MIMGSSTNLVRDGGPLPVGRLSAVSEANVDPWWERWSSYFVANFRAGRIRVKGAAIPTVQTAFFATLSWLFCYYVLDDPAPIFAPIATFVCMGLSRNRELRKTAEMGFGASIGVLIGGLVGQYWGFGPIQLFVLFLICPLLGRLIDRAEMVAFQMAIQSMVVAAMIALMNAGSTALERFLSAIVGSAVALLATVILPTNVMTRPRRYVAYAILEASRIMRRLSKGLLDGDAESIAQLQGRLTSMRELLNDGRRALTSAQETAAVSPRAFGSRQGLAELDRMLGLIERMHVTLSMMQRQGRGMVSEVGPMPELAAPMWHAADLLEQVSKGVADWKRPTEARDQAVQLASTLGPSTFVHDPDDWRSAALVSMLRAVAVDMLELTGLSMVQARAVLADIGDYQPDEDPTAPEVELASTIWGTEQLPAVGPHPDEDRSTEPDEDASSKRELPHQD